MLFVEFRDHLGVAAVAVDEYGVQFLDGNAIFSSIDTEYKIPVENLIEINTDFDD